MLDLVQARMVNLKPLKCLAMMITGHFKALIVTAKIQKILAARTAALVVAVVSIHPPMGACP
jgi:hypothetical protein